MPALCTVRDPADAWLDDPDAVRAEFEALIAANFAEEPPVAEPGPTPPRGRSGPRRRRQSDPSVAVGSAPARLQVATERGPPVAG